MTIKKEIYNKTIASLFLKLTGNEPLEISALSGSGSNRKYFRLTDVDRSVIGVIGKDTDENATFIYFSEHFRNCGLKVPLVLIHSEQKNAYLQEDLGNTSLFDLLMREENRPSISPGIKELYKKSLTALTRFQVEGSRQLDFSKCYPREAFDRQSMQWDLNYFKYYYLKPAGIAFHEQKLETDFSLLMDYLLEAPSNYFMYRDFQARNILIKDEEPWFIDFQGGRRGPLQYDVASLLFQAKADLSPDFREEMLNLYFDELGKIIEFDRDEFKEYYYGFVLLRTLQVLGAYGFRGYFEQKPHFIESTNFALKNLRWLTENINLPVNLPELQHCFKQMLADEINGNETGLTIEINSFSYKKSGIPKDTSGHGGGFVFDCRALPNPGRYPEYRSLTGKDEPVIRFLEKEPAISEFLEHVFKIVGQAIENYLERGFDHLSLNFGCTGGQHRSVYCAESLYTFINEKYPVKIILRHRMME